MFCTCGTRLLGEGRLQNSDLRPLRGRDCFSSPGSSEPCDCQKVTPIRRAPRKRQSLQSTRGDATLCFARAEPGCGPFLSCRAELFRAVSGHHKVDLVERNASVPLKAAETTLRNFDPSLHRKLQRGAGAGNPELLGSRSSPLEPLGVTRNHHRSIG